MLHILANVDLDDLETTNKNPMEFGGRQASAE